MLTYGGQPAVTYYFSTSGGHTENVEFSFVGSQPSWLVGVTDPYDTQSPDHRWTATFSAATLDAALGAPGRFKSVTVLKRGVSPRVVRARVNGTAGSRVVTGPQIRAALGLRDTWFTFVRVSSSRRRAVSGPPGRLGPGADQARARGSLLALAAAPRTGGGAASRTALDAGRPHPDQRIRRLRCERGPVGDLSRARRPSGGLRGSRAVKRGALALALILVALTAPSVSADHTLSLRADIRETGYIRVHVHGQAGVDFTLGETVPGALGNGGGIYRSDDENATFPRFARWRCDRRERTFTVTQGGVSATAEVRTPSCAGRLELIGPRSTRAGGQAALKLRDRWRLGGLKARFCVRAPGESEACRGVRSGRRARRLPVAALRPGLYRLSVRTPYGRDRRTLRANPSGGRLRILATGDSMIQIIDSYLKARAGRARVRSDAHISTGLSKPSSLDWQAQARLQAAARPDVVVMFIGANDGFPMAGAQLLRSALGGRVRARARKHDAHLRARRPGSACCWLLLPAPRGGFFREIFPAVNRALRRAARGLEDDVRVVDLAEVFTPGGSYRDSIQIGGKTVRVRQGDGVHLNTAGASIAANIVLRALRAERILR